MPPTIRRATLSDLDALLDLVHRAYRGDSARAGWTHEADLLDGQRTDAAALAAIINDDRQQLLIAEDRGRAVGCVQVSDQGGGTAYLGMLSVDPTLQTKGLGRLLIDAAEACGRDAFAAERMEMTVIEQRTELIAYYERRGYSRTGETRPFPLDDPRFGLPRRRDLRFVVLAKPLEGPEIPSGARFGSMR
jgi:ribosomal protein S18 acetylase RimI-like enzyme